MTATLRDTLLRGGAVLDGTTGRALHFGEPARELAAARTACVVVDRSDLFRIAGTGPDLADLLQRLGTGDLRALAPGTGVPTVLTSPKGRVIHRLFVHHLGDRGLLLVGGPDAPSSVIEHLRRFTFTEQTGLAERTGQTCQLALVGPRSGEALDAAEIARPPRFGSVTATRGGATFHVLGEDGLTGDGFSIVAELAEGPALWRTLVLGAARTGGCSAGDLALEAWRVLSGVPAPGHELTEEANPLEVGLHEAVSFSKGCYVGQEVVARLNTYDKVSRFLAGLRLAPGAAPPAVGAAVLREEGPIGRVTSAVRPPGATTAVAIALLKRDRVATGDEVLVADREVRVPAVVLALPMDPPA